MLHGWCHVKCCRFSASSVYTIQACTRLQCHFIQSHIGRVYVCLAVTCHLHFWQNDKDLLRATAVTRGWNGYWNKSQHRKLILEKKILLALLPGLKPGTFWSRVRRSNHWANHMTLLSCRCVLAVYNMTLLSCRCVLDVYNMTLLWYCCVLAVYNMTLLWCCCVIAVYNMTLLSCRCVLAVCNMTLLSCHCVLAVCVLAASDMTLLTVCNHSGCDATVHRGTQPPCPSWPGSLSSFRCRNKTVLSTPCWRSAVTTPSTSTKWSVQGRWTSVCQDFRRSSCPTSSWALLWVSLWFILLWVNMWFLLLWVNLWFLLLWVNLCSILLSWFVSFCCELICDSFCCELICDSFCCELVRVAFCCVNLWLILLWVNLWFCDSFCCD